MCRSFATLAGAMALAMLAASPALAEDEDVRASLAKVLNSTPAPNADGPVAPLRAFDLEATQDGTNATLKFGRVSNRIFATPRDGVRGEFGTFTAALSAPVDKKKGHTSAATFDGFTKAASLTLHASVLVVPAISDWGDGGELGVPCSRMREAFRAANPAPPGQEPPEPPPCDGQAILKYTGSNDLVAKYQNGAEAAAKARPALGLGGVFGKVGYEELKYYDGTTLAKTELERTPWKIGGYIGKIDGGGQWSWTLQAHHEVSYKEGDSEFACLPGGVPLLDCEQGAFTRPKQVTKDVISAEGRWLIQSELDWGFGTFKPGVAPKVAYDANNDDWELSFPVYLFADKTGLTGGVRADWNSNDHDIVVGFFVTKALAPTERPQP